MPHWTWFIICWSAPISIGPRQITAWSSFVISPIDIIVTPWLRSGMMSLPSGDCGRPDTPSIRGCDGP